MKLSAQVQGERLLTNNSADDRYASYSPGGNHILFESKRDDQWDIYIMDSNGQNQKRLTQHDSSDRRPSWHPSGDLILFESNRTGRFELYELHIADQRLSNIAIGDPEAEPIFARYSPDGSSIAMAIKFSESTAEIGRYDRTTKQLDLLTDNQLRSFYPNWSPDGERLVFFSRHDTDNQDDEIYTMDIPTGMLQRLTNWPKHNFCPSWSHSGTLIAYVTSMEDIRPEIYVMDADGANQRRITFNQDGDTLPQWSPDDTKLLVTGYRNGNFEIVEITLSEQ